MRIDLLDESYVDIKGCTITNLNGNRKNPLIRVEKKQKATCLDSDVILVTIEDCAIVDLQEYNKMVKDYERLKNLENGNR